MHRPSIYRWLLYTRYLVYATLVHLCRRRSERLLQRAHAIAPPPLVPATSTIISAYDVHVNRIPENAPCNTPSCAYDVHINAIAERAPCNTAYAVRLSLCYIPDTVSCCVPSSIILTSIYCRHATCMSAVPVYNLIKLVLATSACVCV